MKYVYLLFCLILVPFFGAIIEGLSLWIVGTLPEMSVGQVIGFIAIYHFIFNYE